MERYVCNSTTAVVDTQQGKLRGYLWDDTYIFKGIPYAQAKRFHAPQEVTPWEGVLDCHSYGYVCPLLGTDKPSGENKVPHRYWAMNENCQNLNIWTPGLDDEKRPVLVWLHGGGYEAGSSIEQEAYDGLAMSSYGDVVVVSINHRINILGYFDLSDFGEEYENSGNAGSDDIIAALRWVHHNIASFGGDPDNVTVFGQSGGGSKVTTLLQSPDADGLYNRGINMSGVVAGVISDAVGSGKDLAMALLEELGLQSVKELETVDYDLLAKAYKKVKPVLQEDGKYVGCAPHPNKHYLGDPLIHGFREETKQIPLLVGSVYGEFLSFLPSPFDEFTPTKEEQEKIIEDTIDKEGKDAVLPLYVQSYPNRRFVDLLKLDFIFRLPVIEYVRKRSAMNSSTYAYLFNMDQTADGINAPWHCCDIPFAFHNIHMVPYARGRKEAVDLQEKIFATVMAFAKTGDPNNDKIPHWAASTPETEYTLIWDIETEVKENFDHTLIPAFAGVMGPVFQKILGAVLGSVQH